MSTRDLLNEAASLLAEVSSWHGHSLIPGFRSQIFDLLQRIKTEAGSQQDNESSSAVDTLKDLGYTFSGGRKWKPPIGRKPRFADRDMAIDALKSIADPLTYFESQLEQGRELNGVSAVMLSNDPAWLKGFARDALHDIEFIVPSEFVVDKKIEPGRDEAIRVWHKHCDKFSVAMASHPASCVVDAMIDFASHASGAPQDAKDAERLDFLQQRGATVDLIHMPVGGLLGFRIGGRNNAVSCILRDAIDAAMAQGDANG